MLPPTPWARMVIENLNGLVGCFVRHVRRWRNGRMLVRWIATDGCATSARMMAARPEGVDSAFR